MWYKTLILISIFLVNIPQAHYLVAKEIKDIRFTMEPLDNVLYAQPAAVPSAENEGGTLSATGEADPSMERKEPNADHTKTPREPSKKSPPLKDFVPSEEIEADKAVDFPADI